MSFNVFEGIARLSIKQYLDNLRRMEDETAKTGTNVGKTFEELDRKITGAVTSIEGSVKRLQTAVTNIGAGMAGVGGKVSAGTRQINSAAAAGAKAAGATASQLVDHRNAMSKLGDEHKLTMAKLAQGHRSAMQEINQTSFAIRNDLTKMTKGQLELATQGMLDKVGSLRKEIGDFQQKQEQAINAAGNAMRQRNSAKLAGDTQGFFSFDAEYQKQAQAAEEYSRRLVNAQTQVGNIHREVEQIAVAANRRTAQSAMDLNESYAQMPQGVRRARGALSAFAEELGRVEDRFNSMYRAGAQFTQVGTSLSLLGGGLAALGVKLTQGAGDFDFFLARTVAAMKASNSEIKNEAGETIDLMDTMREAIIEVGRDKGIVSFEETAEAFFLYQAALGEQITSLEQVAQMQTVLDVILKASVITGTDAAVAIRGVTEALSEFQIGQEGAAHATMVLTQVTQVSQTEFTDVLSSFKMVGPLAHQLGLSLEEVGAIMARLSDNGIKGSMAGRALRVSLTRLLDPPDKVKDKLQELLVTNQGLEGSWRDLIFAGGEFVGFLDTLDAKGNVIQKGFLHQFAEATKEMSNAQRAQAIAAVFTENATAAMVPLVQEYTSALNGGADAAALQKDTMEQLRTEMRDAALTADVFADQWGLVAASIKVRFGNAMTGLQEFALRLGYMAQQVVIPWLEWLSRLAYRMQDWMQKNPELARTLMQIAAAVSLLTLVAGPLLIMFGQMISGAASIGVLFGGVYSATGKAIAAFRMLGTASATASGGLATASGAMAATGAAGQTAATGTAAAAGGFYAMLGPVALAAAAVMALVWVWKNDLGGLADDIDPIVSALGDLGRGAVVTFGGVANTILGFLTWNKEAMASGAEDAVIGFIMAFQSLGDIVSSFVALGEAMGEALSWLPSAMFTWGWNIVVSLADGIYAAAVMAWDAAATLAEGIAMYFRSFSPPKHGPLKGIYVWGQNLVKTLMEGMTSQDIGAVDDVASSIKDAILANLGDGAKAAEVLPLFQAAHELAGKFVQTIADGGRVEKDFFDPLKAGLGDWYDEMQNILLAYQEVYAAERGLKIEQDKLDLLRAQREELDAQNQARMDAFDEAVNGMRPDALANNRDKMVDPNTEEGQRKIAEMREKLSTEDFQNWIGFQRRLWEQAHKAETKVLTEQERASQVAVAAYEKQLALVQEQYEYFKAIYDYGLKLANLDKEAEQAEDRATGGGGGGAKVDGKGIGTPEEMARFREEIRGVIGDDTVIATEDDLRERGGGDYHEAIGLADEQVDAEKKRLKDLQQENRNRRADYEERLINAANDEEREKIKKEKDAWDAAYKEAQAELQERIRNAEEVEKAAEDKRDATAGARISEKEKKFQEEINEEVEIQNEHIKTAGELKEGNKNLDWAAIEAQEQLQREQEQLSDLQDYANKKKQDFEERIERARAAGNDAEVSRIKEEQMAWEKAYEERKRLQEEEVERAKKAKQEIDNAKRKADLEEREKAEAEREAKEKEGAKKPKGGGAGGAKSPKGGAGGGAKAPIPGGIGNPASRAGGRGAIPTPSLPTPGVPTPPPFKESEAYQRAKAALEKLKGAIDLLKDGSIPAKEKVEKLGEAIAEMLHPGSWELIQEGKWSELFGIDDLKADTETIFNKLREGLDKLAETEYGQKVTSNWNEIMYGEKGVVTITKNAGERIATNWNTQMFGDGGLVTEASQAWTSIKDNFNTIINGEGGLVPEATSAWERIKTNFNTQMFGEGGLVTEAGAAWERIKTNFNTVMTGEGGLVTEAGAAWERIKTNFDTTINGEGGLVPVASEAWERIKTNTDTLLNGEGGIVPVASAAWERIKTNADNVFNGEGGIVPTWEKMSSAVSEIADHIWNDPENGIAPIAARAWDKIAANANTMFFEEGGIVPLAEEAWERIVTNFNTVIFGEGGLVPLAKTAWERIRDNANTIFTGEGGIVPSVRNYWQTVKQNAETIFTGEGGIVPSIESWWEDVKTNAETIFTGEGGIVPSIRSWWGDVQDNTETTFTGEGGIVPSLDGWWQQVKTNAETVFTGEGGIVPSLDGWWTSVKDNATTVFTGDGGIVPTITGAWATLKKMAAIYFGTGDDSIVGIVNGAWDSLVSKLRSVASIISSVLSWIDGRRAQEEQRSPGGTGGGSFDGSHAGGLERVPFDGYLAQLHKGERVLTSAEAALYNSMEANGVLGKVQGALSRAASALAPSYQNVTTNVQNTETKVVNVTVGSIDATNPDEGKAFLDRLAFLS